MANRAAPRRAWLDAGEAQLLVQVRVGEGLAVGIDPVPPELDVRDEGWREDVVPAQGHVLSPMAELRSVTVLLGWKPDRRRDVAVLLAVAPEPRCRWRRRSGRCERPICRHPRCRERPCASSASARGSSEQDSTCWPSRPLGRSGGRNHVVGKGRPEVRVVVVGVGVVDRLRHSCEVAGELLLSGYGHHERGGLPDARSLVVVKKNVELRLIGPPTE